MMKKLATTIAALVGCWLTAEAVQAMPGKMSFTQSDGSSLSVELVGDEFHHFFVTADGLALVRDNDGDFFYRTAAGPTTVMAHEAGQRTPQEMAFVAANSTRVSASAQQPVANALRRAEGNAEQRDATQVPDNGEVYIPIILVNYTDIRFRDEDPFTTFNKQFNLDTVSCRQYFLDQSHGHFNPHFDVLGPVDLPEARSFYGNNDRRGYDKQLGTMVVQAVRALDNDSTTDYNRYDNDGDGEIDVVIVLYAGVGEASSGVTSSIWPCQWDLDEAYEWGYSTEPSFDLETTGLHVNKFSVTNELNGRNQANIDGIGTFCHEFSHCLGLPDFYATNSSGRYGMGTWSLMGSGNYNNNGYTPPNYTAYEKCFMGWKDLVDGKADTYYTLDDCSANDAFALKITNDADSNEYYILENRQQNGWNAYTAGHGLMILHVAYDSIAWADNTVNNNATQRMTIFAADGLLSKPSESGDLYPNGGNTRLTDDSSPAATVYTGDYMGKPITEITEQYGRVSFWLMEGMFDRYPPEMLPVADSTLTTTGFTARWTDVEHADFYTLRLTPEAGASTTVDSIYDTSFAFTGLSEGHTYTVEARATFTDSTTSTWSDPLTITLPETLVLYPPTPGSTTATSLTAHWKALRHVVSYTLEVVRTDTVPADTLPGTDSIAAAPRRVTIDGDSLHTTISGITGTRYTVDSLARGGAYDYRLRALLPDGTTTPWTDKQSVVLIDYTFATGDINADGVVDVVDLTIAIALVMGDIDPGSHPAEAVRADLDGDGLITITDISMLVAIIASE